MRGTSVLKTVVVLGAAALTTSACLSSGSDSSSGSNDNTSNTIEIMTAMTGDQFEALKASVDPYAQEQGITINWQSGNFESTILPRVQGGNPPDIALFPQPGTLLDLAGRGSVAALDDVVDKSDLEANQVAGALDIGSTGGKLYGVLVNMNVKSLVFYPKPAFEKAGYTAPKTQDELTALQNKIKADGTAPWCIGINDGANTGWAATDWIEDLMLKYNGIETYNKWVDHEVKFDSPEVTKAADRFAEIAFTKGNVFGGRKAIASTSFATAGNPMFEAKPGCFLYKQGNFVAAKGFFPDKVVDDIDNQVGVFGFPPLTEGGSNPVLGGGDLAALFSGDNDAAKKIITYMSSKDFGAASAQAGQFLSPRKDFDQSNYQTDLIKSVADIAYGTTNFAFDGSDLMPTAVGAGSFWKQMTEWISGNTDLQKALQAIDASWPTSS